MPIPLTDINSVTELTAISMSWSFIFSSSRFGREWVSTLTHKDSAKPWAAFNLGERDCYFFLLVLIKVAPPTSNRAAGATKSRFDCQSVELFAITKTTPKSPTEISAQASPLVIAGSILWRSALVFAVVTPQLGQSRSFLATGKPQFLQSMFQILRLKTSARQGNGKLLSVTKRIPGGPVCRQIPENQRCRN